jgi:membrane-associated protease RseP (regulator of RpoE activity)
MASVIPTDPESLSMIGFFVLLVILMIKDRKNIEFKYGVFMRRMQKGKEWIYYVGDRHKKFFGFFGYAAIVAGIIASLVSFYLILASGYNIVTNPGQARPGLQPIIPSVPSQTVCSFALCIPFWYWIIGVLIVLLSHELSHAFVSRAENIKIKSFGLLSILILPGAFVEPDERQLKKSSSLTKLKIYAAGSFANILIFFLVTGISITMFNSFYTASGVTYDKVILDSPAAAADMKGKVITAINGIKISSTDNFRNIISKISPGQTVDVRTNQGDYSLKVAASPDDPTRSYIGIANPRTYFYVLPSFGQFSGVVDWIYQLLVWVAFLNIGIGLVNMLPIKPLDGGLVYEEIFKVVFKKNISTLINALSIITFAIILVNVLGPYVL